jgi:hypothetical protein
MGLWYERQYLSCKKEERNAASAKKSTPRTAHTQPAYNDLSDDKSSDEDTDNEQTPPSHNGKYLQQMMIFFLVTLRVLTTVKCPLPGNEDTPKWNKHQENLIFFHILPLLLVIMNIFLIRNKDNNHLRMNHMMSMQGPMMSMHVMMMKLV